MRLLEHGKSQPQQKAAATKVLYGERRLPHVSRAVLDDYDSQYGDGKQPVSQTKTEKPNA